MHGKAHDTMHNPSRVAEASRSLLNSRSMSSSFWRQAAAGGGSAKTVPA